MPRNNNYEKEKFFGLCLIALIIIILLSTLIYLNHVKEDTLTPSLCTFTLIFLAIARFLASMAASLSTYFLISYFEEIGTIYIGRGDKVYFQVAGAIVTFLITFFLLFFKINPPAQC